jgi:hypothetical protein
MLRQLDRLDAPDPVAWRALDYPVEGDLWDIAVRRVRDQAQQRALRSLERRGLIRQETMSFAFIANKWVETPDVYTPGSVSRLMLGVELTDEGRRLVRQRRRG